jgi:UrcA family protein
MSQLPFKSILVAAAAAGLTAAAALAQPAPVGGVTVTAPRMITTGRDATGAALQEVDMTSIVRVDDLDLKTAKGAAELDRRITNAARTMCRQLETLYPVGNPDANTCAQRAIRKAAEQTRAATGRG